MRISIPSLSELTASPRRFSKLFVILATLFLVPFAAFTATASASYANCPSNTLCIWEHGNAGGAMMTIGGGWRNTCWNIAPSMNDKMSSVYNRLGVNVRFHYHAGCNSGMFTLNAGAAASAGQTPFSWYYEDEMTSIWFY